ncbi:MAG TPA: thioesterase family protein [Thermoplasmata archaeon]|nr:thioesterase family protein [Thermoplasmata archaeon]
MVPPHPGDSNSSPPWPVRRHFPVFYHHVDALNHLNHAAYFPFMETLRCDYYLPLIGAPEPSRIDIIVAEATCRYLAPAFYGDELVGEVAPSRQIGKTSFTLLYRFRSGSGQKEYAKGRTVLVCYDYAKGSKKEIPAAVRSRLEKDAIDPAAEGW